MFLAGIELDLDEFQRDRRPALRFGALTFTLPFVLGLLLVLPFGYGFATAALYGSLWASHTLISYPIVQDHGLTQQRAVGMAAGGTVITDTLALFVLAVVVGSVESDDASATILLKLILGLGVLAVYCAIVLPRIGHWALARLGGGNVPTFLFLLAALTSSALVADRVGLEGIVGAFFAGLALNRLIAARPRAEGALRVRRGRAARAVLPPLHGDAARPRAVHGAQGARDRRRVACDRARR